MSHILTKAGASFLKKYADSGVGDSLTVFSKIMVCRSLLLLLESKGFIKLPARKFTPVNPLAKRKKPSRVTVDKTPVHCSVGDLFPIKLEQVRRTRFEKILQYTKRSVQETAG